MQSTHLFFRQYHIHRHGKGGAEEKALESRTHPKSSRKFDELERGDGGKSTEHESDRDGPQRRVQGMADNRRENTGQQFQKKRMNQIKGVAGFSEQHHGPATENRAQNGRTRSKTKHNQGEGRRVEDKPEGVTGASHMVESSHDDKGDQKRGHRETDIAPSLLVDFGGLEISEKQTGTAANDEFPYPEKGPRGWRAPG